MKVPLSRSVAEKRARAAQLAFGMLVVGALAVGTLAVPKLTQVPSLDEVRPVPVAPPPRAGTSQEPADRGSVNASGISERLMQLANHPKLIETPSDAPPDPGTVNEDPAPAPEDARFVGVIREPDRLLAIVHVRGRQRVMAQGEEVEGVKLLTITPQAITISEGGLEKKVEKGARSGTSITMLSGSGDGASPQPMAPPIPGRVQGENAGMEGRVDPQANHPQPPRRRPSVTGVPTAGGNRSR
ncbi:MAG: hypothetical protein GIKADHBN_02319 [Phycisphaerales bacterium]|nr:hypothetical protein [Phycisphaerales bacterium]MCK6476148.1 hypothetical protein [Phycisphaerales bacterium]